MVLGKIKIYRRNESKNMCAIYVFKGHDGNDKSLRGKDYSNRE